MLKWPEFNKCLMGFPHYSDKNRNTRIQIYKRYKKMSDDGLTTADYTYKYSFTPLYSFAPLQEVKCSVTTGPYRNCTFYDMMYSDPKKQEGTTPMRAYNDAYASASVTTTKSDTSTQRDYLLSRLERAWDPKETELIKLFNLNVDNKPTTFKELVAAIKDGKFKVDPKIEKKLDAVEADEYEWFYGPLYGIIFDGPEPDFDGYRASIAEVRKQQIAAYDTIMTADAADGLKALQAFEAWTPQVTASPAATS